MALHVLRHQHEIRRYLRLCRIGSAIRTCRCTDVVCAYEPSTWDWVRKQVERYEASGGREDNTLRDTGQPVVIMTSRGNRTGKLRKTALMRVEHDGEYALIGSLGGAPQNPVWVYNLRADPTAVTVQDGPEPVDMTVREVAGDERAKWWDRAVGAYPPYAEYQARTDRLIPVFVASPAPR